MEKICEMFMEMVDSRLASYKVTHVIYGEVRSVNPLNISIDQKITLTESMLALSKNVTDYKVDIDVDDTGTKRSCTVHNSLKVGEVVALVSFRGGQKYLVVDRV